MSGPRAPASLAVVAALAIVALTLVAYVPAITDGGFVWDDDSYVTDNELLAAPDGLRRIWLSPTDSPQYYPLVFTTFRAEHALWGLDPTGYHVTNVVLHALCALLVWRILLMLGVRGAFVAAAIFAVHPVNVESVAWITERKNTLSALFYLLSLGAYLRYAGFGSNGAGRLGWYAAAFALFVAALLSKTVTCTLPVVVLVLLWWKGAPLRRHVVMLAPLLVVGLVMGALTAAMEIGHVGAVGSEWDLSVVDRVLVAGRVAWFYVGKIIWPVPLAFVYERWTVDPASLQQWLWPIAAAAVPVAMWFLRRRLGRGPLAACIIYVVTLAPALGFMNVFPMRYSFVADHFQYLAGIPVIALLIAAGARLGSKAVEGRTLLRLASAALAVAIIAALSGATWHQAGWYRDEEHLWRSTIAVEPDAAMPHYNLAKLLMERGTPEALDEAVHHFRETLRIKPDAVDVHENLGLTLALLGRYPEAAEQFEAAIEAHPEDGSAHANLGSAYRKLGRRDDALHHYRQAVRLDPDRVDNSLRLVELLAELQRSGEAIAVVRSGLDRLPDSPRLNNSLAAILSRARDPALRDGPAAVVYAERACALTNRRNPAYLNTLVDALIEAGRPDEAVAAAREAMELAESLGDTALRDRLARTIDDISRND